MSRLGEGTHHELRVHGVAGTSAEGMLDDLAVVHPGVDDCGQPSGRPLITVTGRASSEQGLRAYSWRSATSGSVRASLYLLLVPYLLVNLAGWAVLPAQSPGGSALGPGGEDRPWRVRVVTLGVRLAGLALTVIFAVWSLLVLADVVGYQALVRLRGWPVWWIGIGLLGTGAVVETLLLITRLRLRPAAEERAVAAGTDPVGYAWLTHDQARLWDSPETIVHQRRAHRAVALGSVAWIAAGMLAGWGRMPGLVHDLLTVLAVAAVALGVAVVARHSLSPGTTIGPAWAALSTASGWVGRVAVVATAASSVLVKSSLGGPLEEAAGPLSFDAADALSGGDVAVMTEVGLAPFLPLIREVGIGLTIGYAGLAVLAGVLAWALRDPSQPVVGRWAAFTTPALLLLAGAAGGGFGAAVTATASSWLGSAEAAVLPGPVPEALALAFAALMVGFGWVVLVGLWARLDPPDDDNGGWRAALTTAAQRLLSGGSWLSVLLVVFGIAGVIALVAVVLATDGIVNVLDGLGPVGHLLAIAGLGLVGAAIGFVAGLRFGRGIGVAVTLVLLAAAAGLVARVPQAELAGILRSAALTIGLITPASFVLAKGVSALRDTDDRRTIAILWDVGTFFPRWFHPLGPPSYGDHVVTDLTGLVTEELATDPPRTLLLSPHSQGSVIAAAALLALPDDTDISRLALLTHGSPLRQFYGEFFPRLFGPDVVATLHGRLGRHGWRNLVRTSDPISAPLDLEGVDVPLTRDPCGRGHSAYSREPEYAAAVTTLRSALP